MFNDTEYWNYDNITTHRGIWELSVGDGVGPQPSAVRVDAIRVGGNQNFLNFLGQENPTAMLNVKGTTNYETRVQDDDDIPNKKYVDDRLFTGNETSKKIQVGRTFVKINDNSIAPGEYYSLTNRIFAALGTSTNVVFELQENSALLQGITVVDTAINVNGGRGDNSLTLNPYDSTGTVQINSGISLQNIPAPIPRNYSTQVYSTSTTGGGGTGLFYVNTNNTDELVSRKRAIIYGIIF